MGLKQDLIDAKVKAAKDNGFSITETGPGSFIEREAEYTKEAIVNFKTGCLSIKYDSDNQVLTATGPADFLEETNILI